MRNRLIAFLTGTTLMIGLLAGCGSTADTGNDATQDGAGESEAVEEVTETEESSTRPAVAITYTDLEDLYNQQTIGLSENVGNARELGCYVGADGKVVKPGLLIRSGRLKELSDEDADILLNTYNLGTVIDLRSEEDFTDKADAQLDGVEYVNIPMHSDSYPGNQPLMDALAEGQDFATAAKDFIYSDAFADRYRYYWQDEYARSQAKAVFDVLLAADPDEAVLWHCSEGKDRTGVIAMLVLGALGVDEETLLDDYEASNIPYASTIEAIKQQAGDELNEEELELIGSTSGVHRAMMQEALDEVIEEYGSMHDYLINGIGLTEDDITALQEKYLVDAE